MIRKTRVALYTALGHLSMVVGAVGVILPVLPTTPFVLLAFAFYMKGSKRFRRALLRNRRFGPLIRQWTRYGAIPLRAKMIAIVMIVLSITWSMYLIQALWVHNVLLAVGSLVSIYIVTRPLPVGRRKRRFNL